MPAPQKIIDLVKRFTEQRGSYGKAGSKYNEAQVRRDFIDPFFEALGWDVANKQGYAENYREVIHEAKVLVKGKSKTPDYSFRIGGVPKFFVEAKKPSVDVRDRSESAFQIRRYGWSAGLPISILTNFEEFAIYDTRIKPESSDRAGRARMEHFYYTSYVDKWDKIVDLFSKDAIQRGRLDKFMAEKPKGTETIDIAFLGDIEQWREHLASDIHKRNLKLSSRDLNTAVQLIIDRIIFLRICEDRGIESEETLKRISTQPQIYPALIRLFKAADKKYNSGLFHFTTEAGQSSEPDTLTPSLKINDGVLQSIIETLYYPNPYEFSVIPADILGQIYERFLGKVVQIKSKKVTVEEKPEVRKAGGVYYTPSHVVDYIVKNTVGTLLKGSTPAKVSKLCILDPACGSGSFLIVAYQYLLDWHLQYYLKHPRNTAKKIFKNKKGVEQLSIEERKRILCNNIYGTDIDHQAVEVTKLSLLLKILEGADQDAIEKQFALFKKRILPDVSSNIKCGNSLINLDFYHPKPTMDDAERERINVFDWEGDDGFPAIMKDGGFDAIVGNPPYIYSRDDIFTDYEKTYFYDKFKLQNYQLNTYTMFIELGLKLLKKKGRFGYIVPNNWLTLKTLKSFKDYILSNTGDLHIVNYGYQVFDDASVDTSTLIFRKNKPSTVTLLKADRHEEPETIIECSSQNLIGRESLPFDKKILEAEPIISKMNQFKQIGDYAVIKAGIIPYEVGKGIPKQTAIMGKNRIYHSKQKKDSSYKKHLNSNDVKRYKINWTKQWLKYGKHLAAMRKESLFEGERILVRQIPAQPPYSIHATITDETYTVDRNNMIIHATDNYAKAILGLLNSKVLSFWFNSTYQKLERKIFPQFRVNELKEFPMALENKDINDKIAAKVDEIMQLIPNIGKNPAMKSKEKQLNEELDALAYQAYGLSDDDIDFVEKNSVADKK